MLRSPCDHGLTWRPRSHSPQLPFNRTNPDMARKHHCRHCGRCVCSPCSKTKMAIPKFGSNANERVCLLCERVLKTHPNVPAPPMPSE